MTERTPQFTTPAPEPVSSQPVLSLVIHRALPPTSIRKRGLLFALMASTTMVFAVVFDPASAAAARPLPPNDVTINCNPNGDGATFSWQPPDALTTYTYLVRLSEYLTIGGTASLGASILYLDNYPNTTVSTPLVPSKYYQFWIHTAVGTDFTDPSNYSVNIARVFSCPTPTPTPSPTPATRPLPPKNLTMSCNANGDQANFYWQPPDDLTSYTYIIRLYATPADIAGVPVEANRVLYLDFYPSITISSPVVPLKEYVFWMNTAVGSDISDPSSYSANAAIYFTCTPTPTNSPTPTPAPTLPTCAPTEAPSPTLTPPPDAPLGYSYQGQGVPFVPSGPNRPAR